MRARDRFFVDGVACHLEGQLYRVANLGTGGFFAAGNHVPHLGQTLVMDLILPNHGACHVVGEVSWINGVTEHWDELPPGFGVKLTRIDRIDRAAIEELLRQSAPVLGPALPPPLGDGH